MKKYCLVALCLAMAAATHAGPTPEDPEAWYRSGYAPLWADQPGDNIDAMLGYYADTVETHGADGSISRDNKVAWLSAPMKEWLADGWLKAELKNLKTDRLNDTTVVFKASWLDSYAGGETELSCGWYLADYVDGGWQFTAYADIDCKAQGL